MTVAEGKTFTAGIGGAGVEATNVVLTRTNAFVDGGTITSAADLSLQAESTVSIIATVPAISVTVSQGGVGAGVALGAAVAHNFVGYEPDETSAPSQVQAYIQDSTLTVPALLSLDAHSAATIGATVIAATVGLTIPKTGGLAAAGSGVIADNRIAVQTRAYISAGTATVGAAILQAEDDSRIRVVAASATLGANFGRGGAVAVALSRATNVISNQVEAAIVGDAGLTTNVAGVLVFATEGASIDATAAAASIAAASA